MSQEILAAKLSAKAKKKSEKKRENSRKNQSRQVAITTTDTNTNGVANTKLANRGRSSKILVLDKALSTDSEDMQQPESIAAVESGADDERKLDKNGDVMMVIARNDGDCDEHEQMVTSAGLEVCTCFMLDFHCIQ